MCLLVTQCMLAVLIDKCASIALCGDESTWQVQQKYSGMMIPDAQC